MHHAAGRPPLHQLDPPAAAHAAQLGASSSAAATSAHRAELDSFTEFNQVADAFNAMADALRQSDHELHHRAFHDPLTGLANRALLFDRIDHALDAPRRTGSAIGVLFIDVDDFKTVNDSLGHSRGDEVLVEVGRRLRARPAPVRHGRAPRRRRVRDPARGPLRSPQGATGSRSGSCSRSRARSRSAGGEVELRRQHRRGGLGRAARRRRRRSSAPPTSRCTRPRPAARAATARSSPRCSSGAVERLALERDLQARDRARRARRPLPARGRHGRPAACAASRRSRAGRTRERGAVYPDVFIPLAEQSGMIVPLGRRMLARACADLPALRRGFDEPEHDRRRQPVGRRAPRSRARRPHRAAASRTPASRRGSVILEITESQIMSDLDAAVARLHELKALGVHLALDDFGTGYSSLAYLRSFPSTRSRSTARSSTTSPTRTRTTTRSCARSSRSARRSTCASSPRASRTRTSAASCERLGCDRGQGYLFSRPLPRHRADPQLRARDRPLSYS